MRYLQCQEDRLPIVEERSYALVLSSSLYISPATDSLEIACRSYAQTIQGVRESGLPWEAYQGKRFLPTPSLARALKYE